jgi:hypothetical protein
MLTWLGQTEVFILSDKMLDICSFARILLVDMNIGKRICSSDNILVTD